MKTIKQKFIAVLRLATVSAALSYVAVASPATVLAGHEKIEKKHEKKAERKKPTDVANSGPAHLISSRANKVLSDLKSRPIRLSYHGGDRVIEVAAEPNKGSWIEAVYDKNMIEASWASQMLADKRVLAEVLEREMGERAFRFYPKTVGLREFLSRHKMVDARGVITASGDEIEQLLNEEFPAGFVVRPAVGIAPQETARGLYPDTDQFIVELLRNPLKGNTVYDPAHMRRPVKSHILGTIASGEAVVIQESVVGASDVKKPLKERFFQEVRIHTYEGRVVTGAVPERWVQKNLLTPAQVERAESFVSEFLTSLPLSLLNRQAWGVDVAVMDNGQMRIIDIVTNRGRNIAWSGYLDQPRVIAGYSRLFEEHYGLRFTGVEGALIRHGFANYLPFWEKRIEKARPGLDKALAYLPPLP